MKLADFSPPASPSEDDQRDALSKGLGRAVQWAKLGLLREGPLVDACLSDLRYDMQVEQSRTNWLWRMVEILDAINRFRVPILHAIADMASPPCRHVVKARCDLHQQRDAYQLCEIAGRYAEMGDEAFLSRLYEIVDNRPFVDCPSLGEPEILRIDGLKAFAHVARLRGTELSRRDWQWHDERFIDEAIRLFGESEVRQQLQDTDDDCMDRFCRQWELQSEPNEQTDIASHDARMRAISVSEILSEARKQKPSFGLFRGWGMRAEETDLVRVLERLWTTTKQTELLCLLRIFSNRALSTFDSRLMRYCHHSDEQVRHWAYNAIEKNSGDVIRQFALGQMRGSEPRAIRLLVNNYQAGDERTILDCIQLPDDAEKRHAILFDVIDVLEANPEANAAELGTIVYASTPCENCRLHAARRLQQQDVAPDWMKEECRFDSVDDTRNLFIEADLTADERTT